MRQKNYLTAKKVQSFGDVLRCIITKTHLKAHILHQKGSKTLEVCRFGTQRAKITCTFRAPLFLNAVIGWSFKGVSEGGTA